MDALGDSSLANAVGTLVLAAAIPRVISQFALRYQHERWLASAGRHFNIDRPDPASQ